MSKKKPVSRPKRETLQKQVKPKPRPAPKTTKLKSD